MYVLGAVELAHESEQGMLRRRGRQSVLERFHASFERLMHLVADVDPARRILPDKHDGKTRNDPMLAIELVDLRSELPSYSFRERLAVDHVCSRHSASAARCVSQVQRTSQR